MADYQSELDCVIYFLLEEMDIDVMLASDEPNAYWKNGTVGISVNTSQSKRLQLYSLLHEAGHAIIREEPDYDSRFPYGNKFKNKSLARRVDVMREEVMAWEEGLKLAHNLGIEIDLKLWHNFVKKNLFDYVKWAYDPDKFHAETI